MCAEKIFPDSVSQIIDNDRLIYIKGGNSDVTLRDKVNLQGFITKDLQDAFTTKLEDKIPFRVDAMLGNAALQRAAISTSNIFFDWKCYPSFFSSTSVIIPAANTIAPKGRTYTKDIEKAMTSFVETVNETHRNNPSLRFVYQIVDDLYCSAINPSVDLTSNALNKARVEESVIGGLDPGIEVTVTSIDSVEELRTQWFSSDPHWTIDRAIEAYNDVAALLGLKIYDPLPLHMATPEWQGSAARGGLFMGYPSSFWDNDLDFSQLEVSIDGSKFSELTARRNREAVMENENFGKGSLYAYYNYYAWYFGRPQSEVIYKNNGSNNGRTLFIVQHSYGLPLEPMFALNYQTTICIDPSNCTAKMTLNDYISQYDVDDVVIQLGSIAYQNIAKNSPSLLE